MAHDVNNIQAFAVLYDLALTVGSEVTLEPLVTRTLQRLLYHTGFPAGLVHSQPLAGGATEGQDVRIETAVGNYELVRRKGELLHLPAALALPTAALLDAPELLAGLPARRPYRFALRLPIDGFGGVLLLSPEPPNTSLPLAELFRPIMSQLAAAIRICRRLEERTSALEQANRELESFAYSVSHDLRAPLRAVDGYAAMLLEDYGASLDAGAKDLLAAIVTSSTRMRQLIDDILDFSRLARRETEATPLDMGRLAREVAQELGATMERRRLRFDIGELPAAQGDPAMMRQVWVNLLANAAKFTQAREEAVIEVAGASDARESTYHVRDNGVGFDMAHAQKLFGMFERLHRRDQFEGTGLGLAIVKRIVERHGGRVWAEGGVDQGATFHFALPR